MSSLDQMYQQVILDHAKERHGRGLRDVPEAALGESKQYNPLCGDEVTVRVALTDLASGTPRVLDVSWDGEGCSISQASVSVLHDLVSGHPLGQAEQVVDAFRTMIRSRGEVEGDEDVLGDGVAFHGVSRLVSRVKCAMLGWTAFEAAVLAARAASGAENSAVESVTEENR
ncbi:MAG: SUF system NifU family Fe-S cluster assembly protein [Kineosporiaceae bacterium]